MPNKSDSPAPINGVVENKKNISQPDYFVNALSMQHRKIYTTKFSSECGNAFTADNSLLAEHGTKKERC